MYHNLSYPTLLRLSHLHCHVKLTGVQTVQSKVPSKAKVKQSKLFVFASPLSYQYVTIYLSKLLLFFRTTLFIAFRFTPLTGDVALPAVRPVTESAIYDTNFIQLEGTDYKIAYLAYNSFTAGTAEQSEKYNNELRAFSQECKQRGINNLVLDFRYNSGGEMECVQLLADILVPADKLESPFAFLQYNDKQSAQNRDLILDSQLLQGGVNLNLPTVYIITSGTTAGAAEMLINCLKPYMKVVLIGQTTKGEYVATETFINPKYPWAVRPVVCEVFNSNGEADYSAGFKPDIAINETSYLQYYLPLGEPDEILLHTALQVIAGIVELPTPKTGTAIVRSFTTQKNLRKGLIVK